jgi:hypothetical protein
MESHSDIQDSFRCFEACVEQRNISLSAWGQRGIEVTASGNQLLPRWSVQIPHTPKSRCLPLLGVLYYVVMLRKTFSLCSIPVVERGLSVTLILAVVLRGVAPVSLQCV